MKGRVETNVVTGPAKTHKPMSGLELSLGPFVNKRNKRRYKE